MLLHAALPQRQLVGHVVAHKVAPEKVGEAVGAGRPRGARGADHEQGHVRRGEEVPGQEAQRQRQRDDKGLHEEVGKGPQRHDPAKVVVAVLAQHEAERLGLLEADGHLQRRPVLAAVGEGGVGGEWGLGVWGCSWARTWCVMRV